MSSTFGVFETAKSGLVASMSNLEITGHNIANNNTVGYTRQRLITSSKEPGSSVYLLSQTTESKVGQGVDILGIQQIRSSYLDQQYRDLNTSFSYSENRCQALTYLEGLYNETNEDSGLTTAMEDYCSALNSFSQDTSNEAFRTNLQQQALSMTQSFNGVYQEMVALWNDQNDSISTVAQEINSIAEKLAELNSAISSYERSGATANDLRDDRNLLLDKLSGLANVTYCNNIDNSSMTDVQLGGVDLVSGTTVNALEISSVAAHTTEIDALTTQIAQLNDDIKNSVVSAADGQTAIAVLVTELSTHADVGSAANADNADLVDVTFHGVSIVSGTSSAPIKDAAATNLPAWVELNRNNLSLNGSGISIEAGTLTGGQLYAHMQMIAEDSANSSGIPYYMAQLNSLAQKISENTNTIHASGYTYPNGTNTSTTGINFFDVPTVTDASGTITDDYSLITAGNFTISDEVMSSVFNIAGSSQTVALDANNTETGNNTIALSICNDFSDSNYFDKINSIVGHLAIALNTSTSVLDTKESLLTSADTQRASMSAVSTTEETTNLIVFQQSYDACARVISTIDEMLQTLINM